MSANSTPTAGEQGSPPECSPRPWKYRFSDIVANDDRGTRGPTVVCQMVGSPGNPAVVADGKFIVEAVNAYIRHAPARSQSGEGEPDAVNDMTVLESQVLAGLRGAIETLDMDADFARDEGQYGAEKRMREQSESVRAAHSALSRRKPPSKSASVSAASVEQGAARDGLVERLKRERDEAEGLVVTATKENLRLEAEVKRLKIDAAVAKEIMEPELLCAYIDRHLPEYQLEKASDVIKWRAGNARVAELESEVARWKQIATNEAKMVKEVADDLCARIECLTRVEKALGTLVDAVNVEFGDGRTDIGGKTGPALIEAVNALAELHSKSPVPERLKELRKQAALSSQPGSVPKVPEGEKESGLGHDVRQRLRPQ